MFKEETNNKLWNLGFITLNILVLLAFCNLAVFFSFYNYLDTLPIPRAWNGILIGVFSVSSLLIRPFISTILNRNNAIKGIAIGLLLTTIALLLYPLAKSLVPMILLRIFHGAAYVTLVSSSIVLLMAFLPPQKSGQGFGIITIATLLPYAIIPYILENFFANTSLDFVYAITATLMIPSALLLIPLIKQLRKQTLSNDIPKQSKLPKGSLWINVKQARIFLLLLANGLVFAVFSIVIFFSKTFWDGSSGVKPEFFFIVSTISIILTRLFLGSLFDKYNKGVLILISLLVFAISLVLLNSANSGMLFYLSAFIYGLGIGAATPLMNGLMFALSKPIYRGLNTNLMLEMVDSGFFIGPGLCGLAISFGFSRNFILLACAGAIILAATLIIPLIKLNKHINYD